MSGLSGGVTVLSGFAAPNSAQTVIMTSGSVSFASETTVRSVTAAKTWYIDQITVDSASGAIGNIIFKDNTTEIFRLNGTGIVFATANFPIIIPLPVPLALTTSLKISSSGAAGSANITTQGFEQ